MDITSIYHVCLCLSITLALALYIIVITFSFVYKKYEFEKESIIAYIHNSLNSKLIYEFTPRDHCLEGEEKLVLGSWDGTITKCDCGLHTYNRTCTGNDYDQKGVKCRTISGERPVNYTKFNGQEICVKRKGEIFSKLIESGKIVAKNENCPEITCGIVDTLGRKLCVKNGEECPLKKVDMDKNYTNYTNSSFLNEGENDEGRILSLIKLSDGVPCMDPQEKKWTAYNEDEKTKSSSCSLKAGKRNDDRYEKFENFETKKAQLYNDNGLDKYVTQELINDNSPINIYGTTFIGIEVSEDAFNYDRLIDLEDSANVCYYVMHVIGIIILSILATPIVGFISSCSSRDCECCLKNCGGFALCIITIGVLIDFILSIIIFAKAKSIKSMLMNNANFGDDLTNELIKTLVDDYSRNYSLSLCIIILLVILVCLFIATIILSYNGEETEEEADKEKKEKLDKEVTPTETEKNENIV